MTRTTVSILVGVVVGAMTATVAWAFMMAATWSSIHGGMSRPALIAVSLLAMVAPPGCGLLAAWLVRQWQPLHLPTLTTRSIDVKCPHCGCALRTANDPATAPVVVECPIHGPFHFAPDGELTLGPPRKS